MDLFVRLHQTFYFGHVVNLPLVSRQFFVVAQRLWLTKLRSLDVVALV